MSIADLREAMKLDDKMVERIIAAMFRRCEAAVAVGGISEKARAEGVAIPEGWRMDYSTAYWLPPNVALL